MAEKSLETDRAIEAEISENKFPLLLSAWEDFKAFLGSAEPVEHLLLTDKQKIELGVVTESLLAVLRVDAKGSLITIAELDHVKGVDFGNFEPSSKKEPPIQLNVWFSDNTRFYWAGNKEDLEQMRRFGLRVSQYLSEKSTRDKTKSSTLKSRAVDTPI